MELYKFILNGKEVESEYKLVDGDYIKRFDSKNFTPAPRSYKLYVKDKRGDFEIGNDEQIDLSNPDHIEFIMTTGLPITEG